MPAVMVQEPHPPQGILVPEWVSDLSSFIRWTESSDFPESGRITFLHGVVWVDVSMEQLFIHGRLKVRITHTLETIVTAMALGYVFSDRTRLHNSDADLSIEPDVLFVSFDAVRNQRVVLNEGAEEGFTSIEGTPELIVEIVSDSSVQKDTVELREAYFDSGVSEFWLVDARKEQLSFEILKRGNRGFTSTRPRSGGWIKSAVLGQSFRITKAVDPIGNPQFTLEHRD